MPVLEALIEVALDKFDAVLGVLAPPSVGVGVEVRLAHRGRTCGQHIDAISRDFFQVRRKPSTGLQFFLLGF